ncbi:uncharacterized protein LOC132200089 [Neocloeon triangulifer]|uniref:uncharacterized protein LOC132200089 n=1 Tax=Neocloeon triangulifer TaxID=2078957 RepID=UPI00286F4483|nr:uncharacterized protein LOC132200089 [Neocloeon triangulifer]
MTATRDNLSVVFVYDCESCVSEADDPQDAIVYFHPQWVSEQQRLALCGQLMGTTHFFLASFSCPKLICLKSGQFAIRQCGRFILAVGTDHSHPAWVLHKRADALFAMLRLFHGGIEEIGNGCAFDRSILVSRLQDILDTLVPMAQNYGDLFGQEPTLLLPKSASNVFLEAVQVLEFFQNLQGVIGGTILYKNRVVSTLLTAELTRKLIFSDPYHIRNSVETVPAQFELPLGVRLLRVYLEQREHESLVFAANLSREIFTNIDFARPEKVGRTFGSSMIRDVSRIFTVLEEREPFDDVDGQPMSPMYNEFTPPTNKGNFRKTSVPLDDRFNTPPVRLSLPVGAVTPGTLGKILHAKRMSICAQREEDEDKEVETPETPEKSIFRHSPVEDKNVPAEKEKLTSPLKVRCRSLDDLSKAAIPIKGYSFGLPKLQQSPKEDDEPKPGTMQRLFNTICDPTYPVFKANGMPMSHSLFQSYLEQHYCELNEEGKVQKIKTPEKKKQKPDLVAKTEEPEELRSAPESKPVEVIANKEVYKRSLSLPLKSLNLSDTADQPEKSKRKSFVLNQDESAPVPTKLELFSVPDRVETPCDFSGLSRAVATPGARVTTPAEFRSFILEKRKKELAASQNKSMEESVAVQPDEMAKAVLYTYGYQGMTLLLLLENQAELDNDLLMNIESTWLESAPQLESRLQKSLEQTTSADSKESYSYLHLDPEWDALQRGGKWGAAQLSVARKLHTDLKSTPDMTEIIARCEDQIVYGSQYCLQQVFYQQPAGPKVGLPTPADLMGTVPLTAKRRLERDHGIVLL